MLCDATNAAEANGVYHLPYLEAVTGQRHAYKTRHGIEWTRNEYHPPDPKCPECHPTTEAAPNRAASHIPRRKR